MSAAMAPTPNGVSCLFQLRHQISTSMFKRCSHPGGSVFLVKIKHLTAFEYSTKTGMFNFFTFLCKFAITNGNKDHAQSIFKNSCEQSSSNILLSVFAKIPPKIYWKDRFLIFELCCHFRGNSINFSGNLQNFIITLGEITIIY
jgi:hypothetical protein